MFLYSKLIAGRNRTCVRLLSEAFLPLEDREFLRVITPQNGCHRPMTLTILKYTQPSTLDSRLLLGACSNVLQYDISISTLDRAGKSVVQTATTPSSSNYLCADVLLASEIPSLDMPSPVPYMTNANN